MAKEEAMKLAATRDLTKEGLDIEAADSEYTPFTDKELDSALSGKTVVSNTGKIVTSFKKAPAGSILPYVGNVDGEPVYFSKEGVALDGTKLSLATTTISNKGTQGEAQTRSEDEAEFVMNSLNFKEQVALRVLAAIIYHENAPLDYDDSKIKLIVSQSFRVAVEFQNRAIMFRKEEQGGGGETGEVDVDPESLNSNTERILYNINENLKNGIAIKNAEDEDLTVKIGDTVVVDVQDSNLATRGDIESAKSNIIAAMPEIPEFHCNYTPPSESK